MNEILESEIKSMKNNYIIHISLYAIIIMFNFILISKIIWIRKISYYLYLLSSIFCILFFIIPFVPLSYVLLKKISKKNIPIFRFLSHVFCIIAVIFGLFFSIILMINLIESTDFCRECPFNIPIQSISNEYICDNKICILNNENLKNEYPYEYLCNYDAFYFFNEDKGPFKKSINETYEIESEFQIICKEYEINNYIFENDEIYNYIKFCGNKRKYYICKRFYESKRYKIGKGFRCPDNNYTKNLFIFSILNIILNLILSFVPWKSEMSNYDTIMERLSHNNRHSNSLNSTKNESKINKDAVIDKFKRVPTEIIIVDGNKINDANNIDNNNMNNKNDNIEKFGDIDKENNSSRFMSNNKSKDFRKASEYININFEKEKESNKIYSNIEDNKSNSISNPQSSNEIFILKDNKTMKKVKNENLKLNNKNS